MSTTKIEVTTLSAGQPRAYADSRYEYEITVEWTGVRDEWHKPKGDPLLIVAEGIALAQNRGACDGAFGRSRREKEKGQWQWYEAYVAEAREIGPGKAYVKIVLPYCD